MAWCLELCSIADLHKRPSSVGVYCASKAAAETSPKAKQGWAAPTAGGQIDIFGRNRFLAFNHHVSRKMYRIPENGLKVRPTQDSSPASDGAAFANHVSATLLGRAVYPTIFHQDPRYFYKGKGTIGSRVLYAISTAVIARGDDGRWKPNYSRVLDRFSAAAISNPYYPPSDRGTSLVVSNGLAGIGENAASNLVREFVLKRFTSHVPKGANGQP